MPADLFTDDLDALRNDELFAAIVEFAGEQPGEGWRHDYAVEWSDSALTKVAAFAHTFGGLLIVGVQKDKADVICTLPGVQSETEYKTRIASAIAANISPVPSYDIFECHKPNASDRRFCVVRVRETKALHLVTKKGMQPVYVRNEDQTLPADAAQLRRLIDREQDISALSQKIADRALQLRDALLINYGYQNPDSDTWHLSQHYPSPTFLKLEMIVAEATPLELDEAYENKLGKLIAGLYPRFFYPGQGEVVKLANDRHANFYEYTAYHKNLDYESTWRIAATGDIGHATQVKYKSTGLEEVWSVVDLARYVILFATLAMKWWEFIAYLGEAYLYAQLCVDGLKVARHPDGYYTHAFDPTYPATGMIRPDIRKDAIYLGPAARNSASVERIKLTYFSGKKNLAPLTTSVLNQLLRSLGHAVDRKLLQSSVESMIPD